MKDTEGPLGRAMEEPSRLPSTCKTSITFKVDRTSESLRAEGEEIHSKRQVKDNYELICWFQILFPACLSLPFGVEWLEGVIIGILLLSHPGHHLEKKKNPSILFGQIVACDIRPSWYAEWLSSLSHPIRQG